MNQLKSTYNLEDYMQQWVEDTAKMNKRNFTWTSLEEGEDFHQYASLDLKVFSKQRHQEIVTATAKIFDVLQTVCDRMYDVGAENFLDILGIDEDFYAGIFNDKKELFTYFSRMDLVVTDDAIKIIEINSDTPTGYLETSAGNSVICEKHGYNTPNELEFNIFRAWRLLEQQYGIEDETVYFTSYGDNEEDKQTVLFNMQNAIVNSKYIAIEDIVIDESGVYDTEGNQIEYLYRLYPLEFLMDDVNDDGTHIGKLFVKHVAEGTLKIINPTSAFLMQSKSIMQMVTELYDSNETLKIFTEEQMETIKKHFLKTYSSNQYFIDNKIPYVSKPVFGREGGGVVLHDAEGNVFDKDPEDWYSQFDKIYQEYVEMPDASLRTWDGYYAGKLLVGSFVIGGEPSGLFLRVGDKITGNLSMFCGVAVEND